MEVQGLLGPSHHLLNLWTVELQLEHSQVFEQKHRGGTGNVLVQLTGLLTDKQQDLIALPGQYPSPSLVAIEEPEQGIHSGALQIFTELLEYASSNSQIIVATHSSDLLDFLATDSIESIRAVSMFKGATLAGPVAGHQLKAIQDDLLTAGYINRIQGLGSEKDSD